MILDLDDVEEERELEQLEEMICGGDEKEEESDEEDTTTAAAAAVTKTTDIPEPPLIPCVPTATVHK